MNIPIGFRFNPSDETLINGFLLPKVMGHPLPWNVIAEKVLYGDNAAPSEVFSAAESYYWTTTTTEKEFKHTTYVFTTLTRASPKRISRRAGGGTWGGETCNDIVDSTTGDVIGCKRMFKFRAAVASSDNWIMQEYSLPGKANDVVLCRITYSVSINSLSNHLQQPEKRPTGDEGTSSSSGCMKRKLGHESVLTEDCTFTNSSIYSSSNHLPPPEKRPAGDEGKSSSGCMKRKFGHESVLTEDCTFTNSYSIYSSSNHLPPPEKRPAGDEVKSSSGCMKRKFGHESVLTDDCTFTNSFSIYSSSNHLQPPEKRPAGDEGTSSSGCMKSKFGHESVLTEDCTFTNSYSIYSSSNHLQPPEKRPAGDEGTSSSGCLKRKFDHESVLTEDCTFTADVDIERIFTEEDYNYVNSLFVDFSEELYDVGEKGTSSGCNQQESLPSPSLPSEAPFLQDI